MPSYREPQKRRRTLVAMPHLFAYKGENEKMDALRLGLDLLSLALLRRLSIDEDVAEATWFSVLAHRLKIEPDLADRIREYGAREYQRLPETPRTAFKMYTIPKALREVIDNAAKSLPSNRFEDKRGVTSPWVRVALAYCGFVEKQYDLTEIQQQMLNLPSE